MNNFKQIIKQARLEQGLKCETVAAIAGISHRSYNLYEQGRIPCPSTAARVLGALGITCTPEMLYEMLKGKSISPRAKHIPVYNIQMMSDETWERLAKEVRI